MCEVPDERLYEDLRQHVLGCELLAEWLGRYRGGRGEDEQQVE
jgi:hypothetical protein